MNFAQRVFLILLVFAPIATADAHQAKNKGTVIVLYGTSCAGKSTLARELQSKLPGNFLIVKRRPLVEEKKKRLIEKATGIRPKNHKEIRVALNNLPETYRTEKRSLDQLGYEETVVIVRQLLDQGANLIFDACIQHKDLKHFKGYRPLSVLVYAPPEELWPRYEKRTSRRTISPQVQIRKKIALISSFCKHYKRAGSKHNESRKVITRKGMLQLCEAEEDSLRDQRIATLKEKALEYFGLDSREAVEIVPVADGDLFIDTTTTPAEQSLALIRDALDKRQ